jgi:hypothetical protein
MKNKSIVISVSTPDEKSATICIDQHSHISEWEVVFRSILTLMEFSPQSIDELFSSGNDFNLENI